MSRHIISLLVALILIITSAAAQQSDRTVAREAPLPLRMGVIGGYSFVRQGGDGYQWHGQPFREGTGNGWLGGIDLELGMIAMPDIRVELMAAWESRSAGSTNFVEESFLLQNLVDSVTVRIPFAYDGRLSATYAMLAPSVKVVVLDIMTLGLGGRGLFPLSARIHGTRRFNTRSIDIPGLGMAEVTVTDAPDSVTVATSNHDRDDARIGFDAMFYAGASMPVLGGLLLAPRLVWTLPLRPTVEAFDAKLGTLQLLLGVEWDL